jgi:hypothetical protein
LRLCATASVYRTSRPTTVFTGLPITPTGARVPRNKQAESVEITPARGTPGPRAIGGLGPCFIGPAKDFDHLKPLACSTARVSGGVCHIGQYQPSRQARPSRSPLALCVDERSRVFPSIQRSSLKNELVPAVKKAGQSSFLARRVEWGGSQNVFTSRSPGGKIC